MFNAILYLITALEQMRLDANAPLSALKSMVAIYACVFIAVYGAFFAVKAVAVCVMAKSHGVKNWWLGMIPFANYIVIGKLAGPVRVFHVDIKNVGWLAAIASGVATLGSVVISGIYFGEYFVALFSGTLPAGEVFAFEPSVTVSIIVSVYDYVEYFISIINIFAYAMLVYAFFSKYSPDKRWLFTLLCLFIEPLLGIFILVVRKNRAYSSVNEYYAEKYARRFGQTYDPYANPFKTKENPFNDGANDNKTDNGADNDSPFEGF